jgi:hypothetical protein
MDRSKTVNKVKYNENLKGGSKKKEPNPYIFEKLYESSKK